MTEQVKCLRAHQAGGALASLSARRGQLQALRRFLSERETALAAALKADLGKPFIEAYGTEIGVLKGETNHAIKHLGRWMRRRKVATPMLAQPGSAYVLHQPLGVVLIISPWNYPLYLTLGPLIGALAAGNAVVLKPSELAPHTSSMLAAELGHYLDPALVQVTEGTADVSQALLKQPFDHIFFTGSGRVGRIVAEAAATQLIPTTLELGGKSPVLVDRDIDVAMTARRIAFGKFLNAGQTCVAPDYVLVHKDVHAALLEELQRAIVEFFGSDPRRSDAFGRIVSDRHHARLLQLLKDEVVVTGGARDAATRFLAPTLLRDVKADAPVMQEEIFGPILPVLAVDGMEQAIAFVNRRAHPLALYLFTHSRTLADRVIAMTASGSVVVNQTVLQLAVPDLPFGGVGPSGYGRYHGEHGFLRFSNARSVLRKPLSFDFRFVYPPYHRRTLNVLRKLLG